MSKKQKNLLKTISLQLFFITLSVVTLIPIFYALSISFSSSNNLVSSDFSFFPRDFTFSNYTALFTEQPLLRWLGNSMILAVSTLTLSLSVSIPSAYAFSRLRFKGNYQIFKSLIFLNAFPAILSMFALWRLFSTGPIQLINTRLGLIIIYAGTMAIFAILNLKGYFDTIPKEIEDAARIDGASEFQVVTRILLPLAKPSMIVTGVLILIFVWNEYIFAITFMTGSDKYTLAAGLYSLQAGEMSGSWPIFTAAALVTALPVLIIFLIIQRHMVSGLTVGGVKA